MKPIIIEFVLYLSCFYAAYFIFFRNRVEHHFARLILMLMIPVSAAIPLLPVFSSFSEIINIVNLAPVEIVAGMTPLDQMIPNQQMSLWDLAIATYAIVFILLSIKLFIGLYRLRVLYRSGLKTKHSNYIAVSSKLIHTPFSFFNIVYLPENLLDDNPETKLIIKHELEHKYLGHSFDKVILQCLNLFLWWHPAIYLIIKEIELIHEYQVDERITQSHSNKNYSQFLITLIEKNEMNLVNTISSNLKKRIIMMYTQNKFMSKSKQFLGITALLTFSVVIHSCQSQDDKSPDDTKVTSLYIDDGTTQKTYKEVDKDMPKVNFDNNTEDPYFLTISDTILTFDFDTKVESEKVVSQEIEIHRSGQQMPMYPGCSLTGDIEIDKACANKKFMQYIYTSLKYPALAREKGKEGMALIRFIVSDKGTMHSPRLEMDPGYGMGEEAMKMIHQMISENVQWIPGLVKGENAHFEYTLPVKFKLEG